MAGGSFNSMMLVTGYLAIVWSGSKLSKMIGLSTILAEILLGVVTGPLVAKGTLMPMEYGVCNADYAYSCALPRVACNESPPATEGSYAQYWMETKFCPKVLEHCDSHCGGTGADNSCYQDCVGPEKADKYCQKKRNYECGASPSFFVLLGQIGVSLVIFESGMHFDFVKVKKVGLSALLTAVLGTTFPIVVGVGLLAVLPHESSNIYPDALAAGISLAPTSVGIALKLLVELKQLGTDYGQAIITAAFADDVFSLLAFIILEKLGAAGSNADGAKIGLDVGLTFLYSCVMLGGGAVLSIYVYPRLMRFILSFFRENRKASFQPRDAVHLFSMFFVLVLYATVAWQIGSHLLGCFVAGMSFTMVPRSHQIWTRQTKRSVAWLLRLFFAATVGFAIPLESLFSAGAVWKGLLVAIFPCILAKVVSGVHMGQARWIVGWAMVGRAEFAYLIAQSAASIGMMSQEVFAEVIWALLWATIIAPICFRIVLRRQLARAQLEPSTKIRQLKTINRADSKERLCSDNVNFRIKIAGAHKSGVLYEITGLLHSIGLDILEMQLASDGKTDISTFVVRPRGAKQGLDDEKLDEIQHTILDAMDSQSAKIVFYPAEGKAHSFPLMKISMIAGHHPDFIQRAVSALRDASMLVLQANVELHGKTYVMNLLCQTVAVQVPFSDPTQTGKVPMISQKKIRQTKKALQSCIRGLSIEGDVLVLGLESKQLGPTGEIEHDPVKLTSVPSTLKKVVFTRTEGAKFTHPALVPRLALKARALDLNMLAARVHMTRNFFVFYLDDAHPYLHKKSKKHPTAAEQEPRDPIEVGTRLSELSCALEEVVKDLEISGKIVVSRSDAGNRVERFLSFDLATGGIGTPTSLSRANSGNPDEVAAAARSIRAETNHQMDISDREDPNTWDADREALADEVGIDVDPEEVEEAVSAFAVASGRHHPHFFPSA